MQVFAATRRTQGHRRDDISATAEGELGRFPTRDGWCPDNCPNCGCNDVMVGVDSRRITSTFTVVDVAHLDVGSYAALLRVAVADDDWVQIDTLGRNWARALADEHLAVAAKYPVGTVLELRKGTVRSRITAVEPDGDAP